MWKEYLSHIQTAKDHVNLCLCTVLPEPLLFTHNMSHVTRKPVFGVCDQHAQLQRLARVLTLWIKQVEVLYYLGSKQHMSYDRFSHDVAFIENKHFSSIRQSWRSGSYWMSVHAFWRTGPDSSVGRVSAPANGRSRVRSRAVTYQSHKNSTNCYSLGTQTYRVELGLVGRVSE